MNYLERAMAMSDTLVDMRRTIHQNAEVGMDLPSTKAYVWQQLQDMGITPAQCGGGITAVIGGRHGGPVFLLRADMDALPIAEESGLDFACANGAAHACGHDMHTTMLLGAAKLLKEDEEALCGTVKLMFQPGEEVLEGARAMIADGILDHPKVDAAMCVHMAPKIPTGVIAYNNFGGVVNTSCDLFRIVIQGKGGHGAYPHNCVDPIHVGVHIHLALQGLVSRESDPQQHVGLTVGSFHSGDASNIIPDSAEMSGTLRCRDEATRNTIKTRIEEVVRQTAITYRANAAVQFVKSTCAMKVDIPTMNCVGAAFSELFGRGAFSSNTRTSGSEDFAEVSMLVPSAFFVVGGGSLEEGYEYDLHHPKIRFNEKSLPFGAAAFAQGASAWLKANQ